MLRYLVTIGLGVSLVAGGSAQAQPRETISFESRQKGRPVQVTAEIYWPSNSGAVPALVIHHGSSGITSGREGRYAREISAMGVAAVVIDSFKPRGVSSTVTDQSAVTAQDFNLDALKILPALAALPRVDQARIGITGFSKGGTSALVASHERLAATAGIPPGLRYALHVPFYPACLQHYYKPQTTGAPIYMLLGANDTYVGVEPCVSYAEILRTGGARIEVKIFPGAGHGFDGNSGPWFNSRGENYSQCLNQQQADGSWIERKSGATTITAEGRLLPEGQAKAVGACRTLGVSGGGNEAAARQSMEDLKNYVRRHLLGS